MGFNGKTQDPLRIKARTENEAYYFTGKSCKHGHISKRFTLNGRCVDCENIFKLKNKGKYKERIRNYHIKRDHGITQNEFVLLFEKQNKLCKICKKELNLFKATHIDHCHKTNKIRGLLCTNCNVGLGHFKDSPDLLRQAALYCEAI